MFADRSEALAFLRNECPPDIRHVFDKDESQALVELFFQAITSERLLAKHRTRSTEPQGSPGYGAYIREFGIVINLKKAALLSSVLLVDVLVTQGVAALVLSQVMKDPVCIRRLTSAQHLMCVLDHGKLAELTFDAFTATLVDSRCKHLDFACKFRGTDQRCGLSRTDLADAQSELNTFFGLT